MTTPRAHYFDDEEGHLEPYYHDFFARYLSGTFTWPDESAHWRAAMSAMAETWHLLNFYNNRCGLCLKQ